MTESATNLKVVMLLPDLSWWREIWSSCTTLLDAQQRKKRIRHKTPILKLVVGFLKRINSSIMVENVILNIRYFKSIQHGLSRWYPKSLNKLAELPSENQLLSGSQTVQLLSSPCEAEGWMFVKNPGQAVVDGWFNSFMGFQVGLFFH